MAYRAAVTDVDTRSTALSAYASSLVARPHRDNESAVSGKDGGRFPDLVAQRHGYV
jgi:hypothetical protein